MSRESSEREGAAPTEDRPGAGPRGGMWLGALAVGGWLLHDLAAFGTSGEPTLAVALLARSLPFVLAGAVAGWLFARSAVLELLALAATGVAALLPALLDRRFTVIGEWWMRALFGMVLAFVLARRLGGGRGDAARSKVLALAFGALACIVVLHVQGMKQHDQTVFWTALALVVAAWFPLGRLRLLATALVLVSGAWHLWTRIAPSLEPSRADLAPPSAVAESAAPNLLLVVLDTVRADHLAPYGYGRVTTPRLDAFVEEHFTRHTDARATSSWTLPSHASLFTGLLPAEHGTVYAGRFGRHLPDELPTMAEILRDAGYRTAAVMSNNAYLRDVHYGLGQGFERYDDRLAGKVGKYLPLHQLAGGDLRPGRLGYREAATITDLALEWLDEPRGEAPFFLALNYMDAHTPNFPHPSVEGAFTGDASESIEVLRYDLELRYMDAHVARLLDGIRERGLFDSTAIVITSDHGEALGDHGFPGHGWILYESVLHVPLYVKPPGDRAARVDEAPITGAETFHLALGLVGVDVAAREDPGVVAELHVHPEERRTSVSQEERGAADLVTWMEGEVKLIVSSAGDVEAYDLAADPGELSPLELSDERAAEILARARAWWEANPVVASERVELGKDELERLKVLGY